MKNRIAPDVLILLERSLAALHVHFIFALFPENRYAGKLFSLRRAVQHFLNQLCLFLHFPCHCIALFPALYSSALLRMQHKPVSFYHETKKAQPVFGLRLVTDSFIFCKLFPGFYCAVIRNAKLFAFPL